MTADIARIVPGKSDAELAAEHRAKTVAALQPVLQVLDEAMADGFTINFALGQNFANRVQINAMTVSKVFP